MVHDRRGVFGGPTMEDNRGCIGGLAMLGVFAWIFMTAGYSWPNAFWYGVVYHVGIDAVHTSDRPTDCDWTRAPLGSKGCSYKATVDGYNAAGQLVAGDDAPKYGNDKTGSPIVSYDSGKTWWPVSAPDLKVRTVEVRWIKVTE